MLLHSGPLIQGEAALLSLPRCAYRIEQAANPYLIANVQRSACCSGFVLDLRLNILQDVHGLIKVRPSNRKPQLRPSYANRRYHFIRANTQTTLQTV